MANQGSALFSIIIPVKNGEKTLERLFGSLIIQKDRIYEVIVCNDNSTDKTVEIAERYKSVLPITVLRVPEELQNSPGNARQVGLDAASGEWIVFADADDILTFNALGFYEFIIQENPDIKMVAAAFDEVSFNPFRMLEHIAQPFAWVHAKTFNAAYIKKNNLRFSRKLFTHEDKYFTMLNIFTMRSNGEREPFVTDTTTYYWCRSPETIVSSLGGRYPMISVGESMDAIIDPIEIIRGEKNLSQEQVVCMFQNELFTTILDAYHKVQCSRDVWGQEDIDKYQIETQVIERINKIKKLTGWTNEWIIQESRNNPDLYTAMRQDSIRTMREFVPKDSLGEFLKKTEEGKNNAKSGS